MGEGSPLDESPETDQTVASEPSAPPTRRKPFSGEPFLRGRHAKRKRGRPPKVHAAPREPDLMPDEAATPMALSTEPLPPVPPYMPAPVPEPVPGMPPASFWLDLIDTLKNNKLVDQEVAATLHAQAMKKALRPENEVAPGISVYNPKGETKYPRPKPTHIYMLGPYPIADPGNYDTVTWSELELLNQLRPGDYVVTRADNSPTKISIKTEYESNGTTPHKSTIIMPMATDDEKNNWPPLLQLLTEVVTGESPSTSIARYQQRIAELEAKLAASTAA